MIGPTQPYRGMDAATLAVQYDARNSVASFDDEYAQYLRLSEAAMARFHRVAGVVYDEASGQTLDVYPAAVDSPVFVWIHGGYWRSLSKEENAFVAGLVGQGIAVVIVDYTLAPAASLDEITRQIGAAIAWTVRCGGAYGIDAKRLHVGGSSAGGHLVGSLLTTGRMAQLGLPADAIVTATPVSGLFDLEPMLHAAPNAWLFLDAESARRNSPLFHIAPGSKTRLLSSCGGKETAEFQRQTATFLSAWQAAGNAGEMVAMPDHNHFDIAIALATPGTALNMALVHAIMG